ncbi:MAG: hypothetical protein P8H57_07725 [Emcibacteraceae bacterium]|nr:hypothetical protein [Emcibacteraceae bacterium]
MTDMTETNIDEIKRKNAIKAGRTMILMQWLALGLIGIILPLMGVVDETALICTIFLITGGTQALILLKYGINPRFTLRLCVMIITFIAFGLILTNALSEYFSLNQILGGFLAGTGGYNCY